MSLGFKKKDSHKSDLGKAVQQWQTLWKVLEVKIMLSDKAIISLRTEFMESEEDDTLHATEPFIKLVGETYPWKYIFTKKRPMKICIRNFKKSNGCICRI